MEVEGGVEMSETEPKSAPVLEVDEKERMASVMEKELEEVKRVEEK